MNDKKKVHVKPHNRSNPKSKGKHHVEGHTRDLVKRKYKSKPRRGGTNIKDDEIEGDRQKDTEFWWGYREAKEFIEKRGLDKADIKSKEVAEENSYFAGYNRAVMEELAEDYDPEDWENFGEYLKSNDYEMDIWETGAKKRDVPESRELELEGGNSDVQRINSLAYQRRKED